MKIRRSHSSSETIGACSPQPVHVSAPAKINLFLEILGKRPDGFHELASVLLAIGLYDELTLTCEESDSITLVCSDPALSAGPENLVYRAAQLLRKRASVRQGAMMRLEKRIPWAAGLGGGSSDAAAALAGLNVLWDLRWSKQELAALGAELGSDVPFFFDAPAALCTGRGEIIRPVPVGAEFDLVLVNPSAGLTTADVYREYARFGRGDAKVRDPEEVLKALAVGDVESMGRALHNTLQAPAMKLCPQAAFWLDRLHESGAAGCLMSGSGSTVFALCRDGVEARRVIDRLRNLPPPADDCDRTQMLHVRSCR